MTSMKFVVRVNFRPQTKIEDLLQRYFKLLHASVSHYYLASAEELKSDYGSDNEEIYPRLSTFSSNTEDSSDEESAPSDSSSPESSPHQQTYIVIAHFASELTLKQIRARIRKNSHSDVNILSIEPKETDGTYPLKPNEESGKMAWHIGIHEFSKNDDEVIYEVEKVLARYFVNHPLVREKFIREELEGVKFEFNTKHGQYSGQVRLSLSKKRFAYKNPYHCLAKLLTDVKLQKAILDGNFYNLILHVKRKSTEINLVVEDIKYIPGLMLIEDNEAYKSYDVKLDFARILVNDPQLLARLSSQNLCDMFYEVALVDGKEIATGRFRAAPHRSNGPKGLKNPYQSLAATILRDIDAESKHEILSDQWDKLIYLIKSDGEGELQKSYKHPKLHPKLATVMQSASR